MVVITSKPLNNISAMGSSYSLEESGDPYIPELNVAFSLSAFEYYEVDNVPEEIVESKWCYTPADGFFPNPNYQEPNEYGIPDELVTRIKNDAVTEIEEAVLNGTDE